MRAFGGELVEHGRDFDTAREEAIRVARREGLAIVPPFHAQLVCGVATYAWELFHGVADLDTVYVPIGCGSGICATILVRDLLGLRTKVVGVVSDVADCARRSVEAGHLVATDTATTFADGMAVRIPVQAAYDIYSCGADRIVSVSDDECAMRLATHNVAEGAGAAAVAALMRERDLMVGKRVGVILTGGNIDTEPFRSVLAGERPEA